MYITATLPFLQGQICFPDINKACSNSSQLAIGNSLPRRFSLCGYRLKRGGRADPVRHPAVINYQKSPTAMETPAAGVTYRRLPAYIGTHKEGI
jgi:hypothetical protein